MNNFEKYKGEIRKIAEKGEEVAIGKATGKPCECATFNCGRCLFKSVGYSEENCGISLIKWLIEEYEEPKPSISKKDRGFLECLNEKYKYIARDEDGELYAFTSKPMKKDGVWSGHLALNCDNNKFNIDFPMVKQEDEEPWLTEDLKKLEVVEQ